MISLEDIFVAYYDCRRNKRNTASAIEFEINYEDNLIRLCDEINKRTYKPSPGIAFIVTKPKPREIFAANFRDRIIHHLLDLKLRPLIENVLVDTTCNNRIGKGTEGCIKYVELYIKECSENYTKDCYICKMDMKGFFMSISKSILINKIISFTKEKYNGDDIDDICWLLKIVLSDCPEKHCNIRSDKSMWRLIDKSKSLFYIDDDLGLPIGNLISQLMANFYLNDFDHFVIDKFKYYVRYVDDFIIIDKDRQKILDFIPKMRAKLEEVQVTLHPDKFYFQHFSKGVNMTGSVIKPNRLYIHNRTVNNAFQKIKQLNKLQCTYENISKYLSVMNSYLGFMKNRSSYNIRKRLIMSMDKKWWKYFYTKKGFNKIILKNKYKHNNIERRQYYVPA